MICYKDQTFCSSDCTNATCFRNFTANDRDKANALNLPVSWTDFSNGCPAYTPPLTADKETPSC